MSRPAARVCLRLSGWPKVERVLQLIDAVEALGIDPADAAPDYWHHVHNRLSVNEIPRAYTKVTPSGLAPSAEGRTVTHREAEHSRLTIGAVAVLAATIVAKPPPIYIWNGSASVPIGLYRLRSAGNHYVTELLAIQPPEPLATYLDRNGYLPIGVPMLKRVLALPGQKVCRNRLTIAVDGVEVGQAQERDGEAVRFRPGTGAASLLMATSLS